MSNRAPRVRFSISFVIGVLFLVGAVVPVCARTAYAAGDSEGSAEAPPTATGNAADNAAGQRALDANPEESPEERSIGEPSAPSRPAGADSSTAEQPAAARSAQNKPPADHPDTPDNPDAVPPLPKPAPPAQPPVAEASVKGLRTIATDEAAGVLGKKVLGAAGEDIGMMVDVLIDSGGHPRAAVIDFGGFLGVGSRKIAVDWELLQFRPGDHSIPVLLDVARDAIQAAPEYRPSSEASSVVVAPREPEPVAEPAVKSPTEAPAEAPAESAIDSKAPTEATTPEQGHTGEPPGDAPVTAEPAVPSPGNGAQPEARHQAGEAPDAAKLETKTPIDKPKRAAPAEPLPPIADPESPSATSAPPTPPDARQ